MFCLHYVTFMILILDTEVLIKILINFNNIANRVYNLMREGHSAVTERYFRSFFLFFFISSESNSLSNAQFTVQHDVNILITLPQINWQVVSDIVTRGN